MDDDMYGTDVFSVSYSTEGHPRACPPYRSASHMSQNVSQNMSFVSLMSTPDNSHQTNPISGTFQITPSHSVRDTI